MIPTRQQVIGKNKVEEYRIRYANVNDTVVYINGREILDETYDQAVRRLERES